VSDAATLGFLSVVPPLLAIGLAIWSKQVYLSLFAGIWMAWTILSGWNPLAGLAASVESVVQVFADADRTMLIMLSVMIGALLTFSQYSGGMAGLIGWLTDRGLVRSRRSAGFLAWALAGVVFVESTIGPLISGAVTRPLFDRLKISREKLSYILDSMCSPKSLMLPLNTFGAYIVGLLVTQDVTAPVGLLASAVPLNFYAILAVVAALVVAVSDRDFGPMAAAQRRVREEGKVLRDGAEPLVAPEALAVPVKPGVRPAASNLVIPVVTVVSALPVLLWVTGDGNLMNGSGSVSAFWAVLLGLGAAASLYLGRGILSLAEVTDMFMKGVGALTPVGLLLVLAFAIGDACVAMGTGPYVARAAEAGLGPPLVPAALFAVAGFTAFSTGTSFGTWAIMIPIAIPMASLLDIHPGLAVAAVLGGGLFGDHSSPISDSTIVASLAASADHIDHVRTQLPYALAIAGVSLALYVAFGFALSGP
jgi:Na+/H+ antiporter NhaC